MLSAYAIKLFGVCCSTLLFNFTFLQNIFQYKNDQRCGKKKTSLKLLFIAIDIVSFPSTATLLLVSRCDVLIKLSIFYGSINLSIAAYIFDLSIMVTCFIVALTETILLICTLAYFLLLLLLILCKLLPPLLYSIALLSPLLWIGHMSMTALFHIYSSLSFFQICLIILLILSWSYRILYNM